MSTDATTTTGLDLRSYWDRSYGWNDYLNNEVKELARLWHSIYERSRVPEWAVQRGAEIGGEWRLLVISEDWCGDAVNTLPVMARLAEALPSLEMRIAKRDENPEFMDAFLTNGSRSIPLAVMLRPDFSVAGRWGPRPPELQEFVLREKAAGVRSNDDIYRDVRAWYARDRGETTLRQILYLMDG